MIVTEEQAKKLWCPFARAGVTLRVGDLEKTELNTGPHAEPKCIASRCMAWTWNGYRGVSTATFAGQDEAHGSCGLAHQAATR